MRKKKIIMLEKNLKFEDEGNFSEITKAVSK